eukprot:CAMPEP_0202713308 /NCGR_PEP_ID=MMETSP1385-20130828/52494_1 /ASSEMBLY_ACC=CAM_ASM_000861 /TAXON_ID=933848 /ORGANISM="Elphidium margaritaceum" /LENGTH=384 /DNA_ID=CAMNT_0049373611 /DNA_START=12 /DNA_END=1166 /DNA_ORIENTATION=+
MKFKNGEEFVKSLVIEYCPEPSVSSTIKLDLYFKKAHDLFYHGLDFVKDGNDARSYIELMRYSQLMMAIATHNAYSMKQYEKEKNVNKRRLNNAITKLEGLKPKLIQQYNEEIKKEEAMPPSPQPTTVTAAEVKAQEATEEAKSEASAPPLEQVDDGNNSNANTASADRWRNLKLEASPQYDPMQAASAASASSSQPSKLDAIFKQPPPSLTPIVLANNVVSDFIKYADMNTKRDIETCGVLTGKYDRKQDTYVITHVIIPKQKGSANTVQTLNEEELIGVQEKYEVVTLGWIHTHPSQTCFLSSVDMHCQLSYQIMMPNAIAIVYAPKDKTETFSLTKKGVSVLSNCSCQGFHRHEGVTGLYHQATHAHFDKKRKCKFVDLRK